MIIFTPSCHICKTHGKALTLQDDAVYIYVCAKCVPPNGTSRTTYKTFCSAGCGTNLYQRESAPRKPELCKDCLHLAVSKFIQTKNEIVGMAGVLIGNIEQGKVGASDALIQIAEILKRLGS